MLKSKPFIISIIVVAFAAFLAFLYFIALPIGEFLTAPFVKYPIIEIPEGEYISYDELFEKPAVFNQHAEWFTDISSDFTLSRLKWYMRINNLYIAPGDYEFESMGITIEDYKRVLVFVEEKDIAN